DASLDELRQLADLLAGHRIDETGGYVPVEGDSLKESWQTLRQRRPGRFRPSPEQILAWHHRQGGETEGNRSAQRGYLTALIARARGQWRLYVRRGRAQKELENWVEAVADLTKALEIENKADPSVWHDRGEVYAEQGQWQKSAADFARGVELGLTTVRPQLAIAHLAAGDRDAYRRVCAAVSTNLEKNEGWPLEGADAFVCTVTP